MDGMVKSAPSKFIASVGDTFGFIGNGIHEVVPE